MRRDTMFRGPRGPWQGRGERRGRPTTTDEDRAEIIAWFRGTLVDGWYVGEPEVEIDDYEIVVVGTVSADDLQGATGPKDVAERARIDAHRTDTRARRMEIAERAEERFRRAVSWGCRVGGTTQRFTAASVPFMTRLPMSQRRILDTLVDAGVARSRSDALSWCVELVGKNESEWIDRLREALDTVAQAREARPGSESPSDS